MSKYPLGSRRTFFSDKTIRQYEDLPKDYRDQVGLPFRSSDLKDSEVVQIFGKGINAPRANHLLRILHGRRVAGTLDDPAFAIHTKQFTKSQKEKALEYLRKTVPVNEVLNAGLRAEDELAQIEAEAEAAEAKNAAAQAKKKEEVAAAYKPDSVYGHSAFDEIRSVNVAKRKARELADEEQRKLAEERGEHAFGPLAQAKQQIREISNPKIAEYAKAAQSDLEAPPEMKPWERVLPSVAFVALTLGFLVALSTVYEEPSDRFRLFPDISTANATVAAIIAANVLIWMAWKTPPLWAAMNKYMIMVVATVRPITMFTAPFSHQQLGHLFMNMTVLWLIGPLVHEEIGRANFLTLFLGCGAIGFLGSLATYTARGLLHISTLGSSGATLGLCAAYFYEHRDDGFRFFGLPDGGVHGIVLLAGLLIPQILSFGYTLKRQMDIASHLMGMVAGIVGMDYLNRAKEKRKQVIDFPPRDQVPEGVREEGAENSVPVSVDDVKKE